MFKSLARLNIGYQWKLFLAAIFVLTLSGALIYVAIGISLANIRSLSAYERVLSADLFLVKKKNDRGMRTAFPFQIAYDIENDTDIVRVEALRRKIFTSTYVVNGRNVRMSFTVLDDDMASLRVPNFFDEDSRALLKIPGHVFIGRAMAQKYQFNIGDNIASEKDLGSVTISGIVQGDLGRSGNITGRVGNAQANFMSASTAYMFGYKDNMPFADQAHIVMIELSATSDARAVQDRIERYVQTYGLEVIGPKDFQASVGWDFILENKAFQGFIVVGAFAVLIPLFIVVQTLRSALMAQKVQFATLRALGVSARRLMLIAMEQALWVGLLGAALSFCIMLLVRWKLFDFDIMMYVTAETVINVSLAIILASLFAGLLSLLAIFKTHPQELLR